MRKLGRVARTGELGIQSLNVGVNMGVVQPRSQGSLRPVTVGTSRRER